MLLSRIAAASAVLLAAVGVQSAAVDQKLIRWLDTNRLPRTGIPKSFQIEDSFWKDVHSDPNNYTDSCERILATYGLNLYDGACWSIALSLNGDFLTKVDPYTKILIGHKFADMNLMANDYKTFKYGDNGFNGSVSFFFRMTSDNWLNRDPLTGLTVSWMDWRPVTGENAWLSLIGPLQSLLIWKKQTGGQIKYDMTEVQLAIQSLDVFKAMQSKIGAVYYAPNGTYGLEYPTVISAENNVSLYSGLNLLRQILLGLGDPENKLPLINDLIAGIARFMKEHAYDKENGIFYQGGYIDGSGAFVPNKVFPLDVQTWGLSLFGEQTDSWFGVGTSYNIWQKSKERSGVVDVDGSLQGVGYTDGHDVVSGEWTLGAINMCRILAKQYETTKPDYATNLLKDAESMRKFLETERVEIDASRSAYRYANKRYYIPFGWWANPVPSTASTAWTIMVDSNFNPFYYTGEYLQPAIASVM